MSKKLISIISLILASLMILSALASCTEPEAESHETTTESLEAESSESTSEKLPDESESDSEAIEGSETTPPARLEGEHAAVIENANKLANGLQTFYNADRSAYSIKNLNTTLEYTLTGSEKPMVASLKNSKGNAYFTNCMDVFVTTTAGKTYYASNSGEQARVNLYRLGYYYYDVHFLEQDFVNSMELESSTTIPAESFTGYKDVTEPTVKDGVISATIIDQEDPQFFAATDLPAADYNYLQFSFKGNSVGAIVVYVIAGTQTHHNNAQSFTVEVTSDGNWHTYTVPLNEDTIPGYTGQVKGVRFDFGGAINTEVAVKDVSMQKIAVDSFPLSLDRIFHSFPDKLHQEIHIVAYKDTANIDTIGIETKFPYDTVEKFIVKDANGLHDNLKEVDWDTAEFVGFDVKDAGIFGYILPYDGESGKINVRMYQGNYLITQTATPKGGVIKAPVNSTANDFSMGHRIYTDESHDFAAFLEAAYVERNPLTEKDIVIDDAKFSRGAKFKGYDALRGVYQITLKGASSFNDPYYNNQNLHYNASFRIKNDSHARQLYVMTYTSSGCLECAAIMNEDNLLLPIPLQVSKNFSEKEEPFYNCGDAPYGETFFPITLDSNEEQYYTVLNIYQNWGNYPLKQLSSIGYYMPYYHLSTGVTESNCISPWYNRGKNLWTLPDHRPASMPKSSDLVNRYKAYGNQPQTPNAGYHYFLQYVDADGRYVASEYVDNFISSYGPTYADVTMNYLSDDGKIKVSYRHIEMPQTDENRAYYEMTYEVLDTIVIDNFREDFSFYTMTGFINYKKIGYLNKNGEPSVRDINNKVEKPFPLILSKECPYFSLFSTNHSEYANLAFLIYNSEFIMGGEKTDANFVVMDQYLAARLSLDITDKVTLQKGDKFTINCIIMPWGGGYILDDGTQYHPTSDINVQNVRLNSLLNPFTATPVENCEKVESVFLPRVKSTDGKSAAFTVSGGCDINPETADAVNITVRADGFEKLARIKVEELVDGNWIAYELSSINNPDANGRSADYDGYQVHYDGDGTFSYSFVVTITDGVARTFRVVSE